MAEKRFLIPFNQRVWDTYFNSLLDEWEEENSQRVNEMYSPEEEQEHLRKLSAYNKKSITPYGFEFIRKKQSIQQYKPIVMSFERFVNKPFNEISSSDVDNFKEYTTQKCKLAHLNAFFLECISRKIFTTSNVDFMISLLPDIYQNLGRRISEISTTNSL